VGTCLLRGRYTAGTGYRYAVGRVADIEVRVLGRPQVTVDGTVAPVSGRQLLLATRLALAHPVPVPRHRLLADVWPDESVSDGAVRVALTRLRGALGRDVIARVDNGYRFSSPTSVDADRFQRLVREDVADDPRRRLATLDEALGLWSGAAFEGCDGAERLPWVESEAVRLEELREQAIDERFELLLQTEDGSRIIPDLRSELGRDPTRERRAELLAVALYRAGRQADALAAIERTRTMLRDRLGLDPGPSLREVELRILRQDDALRTPAAAPADPGSLQTEGSLRSAAALTAVGAFPEAHAILDAAIATAREAGDRRALANALLAAAQTAAVSAAADPHPLIDEAREIGRQLRDGQLLARSALVRFGSGISNDKNAALIELTEPLDLLPPSAPEQIDLLCAAAVLVIFIDASDAADQLMAAAERLHRAAPTTRSEVVWLTARSLVGSLRGLDPALCDEWSDRALDLAREAGQAELVVMAIQARLRALYTAGRLDDVDDLLEELQRSSREGSMSFGVVRVTLCRATNAMARGELAAVPELLAASRREGRRLRTFSAEGAARAQEVLLMLELDQREQLLSLVRPVAAQWPASAWHAVLALCGDPSMDLPLLEVADHIRPDEDSFPAFIAMAAEVAARAGDAELGTWCLRRLEPRGDATIVVGLGTIVMGFARHFSALARVAIGDLDGAATELERAAWMSTANGAHLWRSHATVELADVLARSGRAGDGERALLLLDGLGTGDQAGSSPRVSRRRAEVATALGRRTIRADVGRS
jgi:DNA-binding SARP family transcriptional activator